MARGTWNSQQMAQYWPPAHPICLRGALGGYLGVYDYGGFGFCWSLRSKNCRSTAISLTGLLKSHVPAASGPAAGHAPARAVHRPWPPLVMWKRAYSPRHDAPNTKNDAKRTGGSEVTAFRVHQQGQCKCQCASSRPNMGLQCLPYA
jgi:hypothetical protein